MPDQRTQDDVRISFLNCLICTKTDPTHYITSFWIVISIAAAAAAAAAALGFELDREEKEKQTKQSMISTSDDDDALKIERTQCLMKQRR